MILLNTQSTVIQEKEVERPIQEIVIEMISSYMGDGGTLIVSQKTFDYLQENCPEVFDYGATRGINIVTL